MTKETHIGKKLAILLLLSFLAGVFPLCAYSARPESKIDVAVKAGYDDIARVGSTVTYRVTLVNKGEEAGGELQVLVPSNPGFKIAYASPFSLPKGSTKEITMKIPVLTANKKVEVKLVSGNRVIKTGEYEFKRLISPEIPVVGILCDDQGALRALNGMKMVQNVDPKAAFEMQQKMMAASGASAGAVAVDAGLQIPEIQVEAIQLDAASMPDDPKSMSGFDMLVISNFDTASLSEKQTAALEDWVKNGKALFLGTGSDWKKVYGGLKSSLKPFAVNGTTTVPFPKSIGALAEKTVPPGNMVIARGNAGDGKVILKEDDGTPLAVTYKKGLGSISVLAFDPAKSPIADWHDVQFFWKAVIKASADPSNGGQAFRMGIIGSFGRPYMDFQYLASNVPDTQSPPFLLLLVLVGVYILIAGPVIYLILKWRDKRDFSWLLIPLAAFLFMGTIYVAGYKTRYTTAVLNNISLIEIDPQKQTSEISTWMGAFNNCRGTMKISYDRNINLEINTNYYYDRPQMAYSSDDENKNARVLSKLTFSDRPSWELYDVRLWEPRYIYASKSADLKDFAIDWTSSGNGKFRLRVKNSTSYDLRDSFVLVGNNYVDTGNIAAGEEKNLEIDLGSSSVKKRFEELLDSRYGPPYYGGPGQPKPPADYPEKLRKRNILENMVRSSFNELNNVGGMKLMFFALNYDGQAYDILINDKAPKLYNTNVVFSNISLGLEKGKHLDIPSGIFRPVIENIQSANFEDPLLGGMRVFRDGDTDLKYSLPANLEIDRFRVDWSTFLPGYVKYRPKPVKGQPQQIIAKNTYKFYIYNCITSQWEEFNQSLNVDSDVSRYIDKNRELRLRVNTVLDKTGSQEELLSIPELELSGVAN